MENIRQSCVCYLQTLIKIVITALLDIMINTHVVHLRIHNPYKNKRVKARRIPCNRLDTDLSSLL